MELAAHRTAWQAAGLVLAGAVAGGVLAAEVTASAASSGSTPASPYAYGAPAPGYGGPGPGGPGPGGRGHGFGLPLSGSVSAVSDSGTTKSVTIKTSSGSKTYAVDSNSDIDKFGEATLSDLKSGDAVRFSVRPGTSTIAVLHAGDEAKDAPAGGPGGAGPRGHGGPCPGMNGPAPGSTKPAPTPTSTT